MRRTFVEQFYYCSLFLLCFLVLHFNSSAQKDSTSKFGTIKIVKQKAALYVKATMVFYKYSPENTQAKVKGMTYADLIRDVQNSRRNDKAILVPHPKETKEKKTAFDYTAYFLKHPEVIKIKLPEGAITDTVRLMVYVTKKGEVIFSDLTPSQKLGKIVATFDSISENYKVDLVHYAINNAFKDLVKNVWEPAYILQPSKEQFKKTTVIKPKKIKANASGVLTVVVSNKPFSEDEWK